MSGNISNIPERLARLHKEMRERNEKIKALIVQKSALMSSTDSGKMKKIKELDTQIKELQEERTGHAAQLRTLQANINAMSRKAANRKIGNITRKVSRANRARNLKAVALEFKDVDGADIAIGTRVEKADKSMFSAGIPCKHGTVIELKKRENQKDAKVECTHNGTKFTSYHNPNKLRVQTESAEVNTKPIAPNESDVKDGKGSPIHLNDKVRHIHEDTKICTSDNEGIVIGFTYSNTEGVGIRVRCGSRIKKWNPMDVSVVEHKGIQFADDVTTGTITEPPMPSATDVEAETPVAEPPAAEVETMLETMPSATDVEAMLETIPSAADAAPAPAVEAANAAPAVEAEAAPAVEAEAAPEMNNKSAVETVHGGAPLTLPKALHIQRLSMKDYKALPNKKVPVVIETSPSVIEAINGYACEVMFDNLPSLGDDAKSWTKMLFFPPNEVFDNTIQHVLPEQICFIIFFNELFTSAITNVSTISPRLSSSFTQKFNAVQGYLEQLPLISPVNEKDFETYWDHLQTKYIKDGLRTIKYENIKGAIIADPSYIQRYFEEGLRLFHGEDIEDSKRFFRQIRGSASQHPNAMTIATHRSQNSNQNESE